MVGSMLGTLRRIFLIFGESIANLTESYWETLIRSSVALAFYLAVEFVIFGLNLGIISVIMPILMGLTITAWIIVALPVIALAIAVSNISFVGKILKSIPIILIFSVGISVVMIKGHLWEYPTISWMLLFTTIVLILGQIFTVDGFAKHIITASTITFSVIVCVVVPIVMFVPHQIQSNIASKAIDHEYKLLGAKQEKIDLYLCGDEKKYQVCDRNTKSRVALLRANGDQAVFVAEYDGEIEFYNNPGKHLITGKILRPAIADDLSILREKLIKQAQEEKQRAVDIANENERLEKEKLFNSFWHIPAGTRLLVYLRNEINTENNTANSTLKGRLKESVFLEGDAIINKGCEVIIKIQKLQKGTKSVGALLQLKLTSIIIEKNIIKTNSLEWQTSVDPPSRKSKMLKMFGGIIAGSVIGAKIDGKRGAIIGGSAGAGGGYVLSQKTGEKQIVLPYGTVISFVLANELAIPK